MKLYCKYLVASFLICLVFLNHSLKSAIGADCVLYENSDGSGWSEDVTGETKLSGSHDKNTSSVRVHGDGVLVFLYKDLSGKEEALVLQGSGLHAVPDDWNDTARFARTVNATLGKRPTETLKHLDAIQSTSKVFELKALPPLQDAANRAKRFAQGNEGDAWWEYCKLDLGGGRLTGKLWVRHHQVVRRGLPPAYDYRHAVEFDVGLDPDKWDVTLDFGRGVKVKLKDILVALAAAE